MTYYVSSGTLSLYYYSTIAKQSVCWASQRVGLHQLEWDGTADRWSLHRLISVLH